MSAGLGALALSVGTTRHLLANVDVLPVPDGDIVLTIRGAIGRANVNGMAVFDRAMLASLPQIGFTTSTQWTPQRRYFKGPSLRSILAAVGVTSGRLTAVAANDYSAVFDEVADLEPAAPILAFLLDDEPFGLRDRGPIWIMYPFDDDVRYRNELTYARCVWQLTTLIAEG